MEVFTFTSEGFVGLTTVQLTSVCTGKILRHQAEATGEVMRF